jgi:hypothetical protein
VLRSLRSLAAAGLAVIAMIAACGDAGIGQDERFVESADACAECQTILVECTSTSSDESQFVACRDQWQDCQLGHGLGPDMCENPRDHDACDLCRARMDSCRGANVDEALCEQQFSVCKAFLITRSDIEAHCTANEIVPPEASCTICQADFATCMSDASLENAAAVCSTKRENCLATHMIDSAVCPEPTGSAACALCSATHAECVAAAGPSCNDGFDRCASSIAADVTCTVDTANQGGQGGGGQGGQGGGGPGGAPTCAHDVCSTGVALSADCSSCASAVCASDSWCCSNEWDTLCVGIAQDNPICGCAP